MTRLPLVVFLAIYRCLNVQNYDIDEIAREGPKHFKIQVVNPDIFRPGYSSIHQQAGPAPIKH